MFRRKIMFFAVEMLLLILMSAAAGYFTNTDISANRVIENNEEVITLIRNGLKNYSSQIIITFESEKNIFAHCTGFAEEWLTAALTETDDPAEGDYIRYQYGGYSANCTYEKTKNGYSYTVKIIPKYYSYLVYEEKVTERLEEIFRDFGFDKNTSDYEKVRTIYYYLCSNVSYDTVHRKNPYYFMRSTSYAALVQKTATCQGYCVTLYRMLRKAGIDSRIITGEGYGEDGLHAWNIAEIDGIYYNLDATWDAGKNEYDYFLKGISDFPGHTPDDEFLSKEFCEKYPIAENAYEIQ